MRILSKKLFTLFITIILVSIISFLLFQIIPGDTALTLLGIDAEEGQIQMIRDELNLDKSPAQRYILWISQVSKGDFGQSFRFSMEVKKLIYQRLPVTITLSFIALLIGIIVAIPMSVISVRFRKTYIDYIISISSQIGIAIPSFWIGILLILIFSVKLKIPLWSGYISFEDDKLMFIKSLILPAIALAIPIGGTIIRYLRNSLVEELKKDYIKTALSKGIGESRILYTHALQNALLPVITIIGMIITSTLGGSLIIEQVFSLPGVGRLLISAISYRDIFLVQGIILYMGIIVIVVNLIIDIVYMIIDPRIKIY